MSGGAAPARRAPPAVGGERPTLPQIMLARARAQPRQPYFRERDRGIWQTWGRQEVAGQVEALALALRVRGLHPGDKVAIASSNRPEAFWIILAVQALRGVPVPVYQDAGAKEIQYVIDHADARFVLAEDQEQVDKLLEVRPGLPRVEQVFFDDGKGLRHYERSWLTPLTDLLREGREEAARDPRAFEALVAAGRSDDVAIICYTSGTTGLPKGALLTHDSLVAGARIFLQQEDVREGDDILSYLPLAWVGEVAYSLGLGLVAGLTVNFPERAETVQANVREIGPQLVLAPPRMWENAHSEILVRMEDATPLKRWVFRRLVPVGEEVARRRMEGRPVPLGLRAARLVGELLVFRPLRDLRGIRRMRYAYTGGAPLGPEIILFFRGIGVNLKQIYGQTESCAFCCGQPDEAVKLGTVGLPFPGNSVRITPEGEILTRGPTLFAGYYKNPEATREAIRDGWLHSGDAGFLDPDGQLVVVDRLKDVTRLAGGATLAPQFLENKLKFSPYVKEAVVFGPGRPHVAAMVNIDMENVGKWAERRQLAYTTFADLAAKPEVVALIGEVVARVNRDLPAATQVRCFLLLPKELDPDDEEITRTRKLRRGTIAEKYAPYIEGLYGDRSEIEVDATVTYEDGRRATLRWRVRVVAVDSPGVAGG